MRLHWRPNRKLLNGKQMTKSSIDEKAQQWNDIIMVCLYSGMHIFSQIWKLINSDYNINTINKEMHQFKDQMTFQQVCTYRRRQSLKCKNSDTYCFFLILFYIFDLQTTSNTVIKRILINHNFTQTKTSLGQKIALLKC